MHGLFLYTGQHMPRAEVYVGALFLQFTWYENTTTNGQMTNHIDQWNTGLEIQVGPTYLYINISYFIHVFIFFFNINKMNDRILIHGTKMKHSLFQRTAVLDAYVQRGGQGRDRMIRGVGHESRMYVLVV